ncbi:MAG: hypothetical protein ACI94Y_004022 [Maribacter sp.]|jgi:hypothetical protein
MFLRALLLDTDLEETIKWDTPVYSKDGKKIIGISTFKDDVGLCFFEGELLYLAVFALQTNLSSNCLIFRSYEFLTIRKPINSQYTYSCTSSRIYAKSIAKLNNIKAT